MVYVILGQTASGKTGLACKLARELNLPLIGADAFQMYKELNIGSAKPTAEELNGITYHLIGSHSIKDEVNVKVYQEECRKLLDFYQSKNQDVILSGGTFLYVKAALYPYVFSEEEKPDDNLESLSKEELNSILEKEDAKTYQVIDKDNLRRVVRAIRMARSGKLQSEVKKIPQKLMYPAKFFSIKTDLVEGNKRIENRVDEMFTQGLVSEVKNLINSNPSSLQAFQAIGYKEVINGLSSNQSEEEIKEQIKIDTRQYAKRQRTFLRHQFFNLVETTSDEIFNYVSYDCQRRKRNRISIQSPTLSNIEKANVVLVGLGGVGSIVATGLVRLGVSHLTVIDKDSVEVSNLNRQVLYTKSDIGAKKAEACKKHLLELDPYLAIKAIDDFYKDEYILPETDFVFDCIDDIKAKASIVINCKKLNVKCVCATGSGLRKDSTKFKVGNLSLTGEPLAKALKKELSSQGFTDFSGVNVVYSSETPIKRLDKEIGSNVISPNSEGLGMLSFFLELI